MYVTLIKQNYHLYIKVSEISHAYLDSIYSLVITAALHRHSYGGYLLLVGLLGIIETWY